MYANRRVRRLLNPGGQLARKWGPPTKDPFEAEETLKTLQPLPALTQEESARFQDYWLDTALHLKNPHAQNAASKKQGAALKYLTKKQLQAALHAHEQQINDEFARDFHMWLVGKTPTNPSHPAYVRDKEAKLGIDPNHGNLPGTDIPAYLESFVDKKSAFMKKYAYLRMGPNKAFPWSLAHYWLYYKYILRGLPYTEDQLLGDFDKYFPDNSGPRPDEPFRTLPGQEWRDTPPDEFAQNAPGQPPPPAPPGAGAILADTPPSNEFGYGQRSAFALTWGQQPYICVDSLDIINARNVREIAGEEGYAGLASAVQLPENHPYITTEDLNRAREETRAQGEAVQARMTQLHEDMERVTAALVESDKNHADALRELEQTSQLHEQLKLYQRETLNAINEVKQSQAAMAAEQSESSMIELKNWDVTNDFFEGAINRIKRVVAENNEQTRADIKKELDMFAALLHSISSHVPKRKSVKPEKNADKREGASEKLTKLASKIDKIANDMSALSGEVTFGAAQVDRITKQADKLANLYTYQNDTIRGLINKVASDMDKKLADANADAGKFEKEAEKSRTQLEDIRRQVDEAKLAWDALQRQSAAVAAISDMHSNLNLANISFKNTLRDQQRVPGFPLLQSQYSTLAEYYVKVATEFIKTIPVVHGGDFTVPTDYLEKMQVELDENSRKYSEIYERFMRTDYQGLVAQAENSTQFTPSASNKDKRERIEAILSGLVAKTWKEKYAAEYQQIKSKESASMSNAFNWLHQLIQTTQLDRTYKERLIQTIQQQYSIAADALPDDVRGDLASVIDEMSGMISAQQAETERATAALRLHVPEVKSIMMVQSELPNLISRSRQETLDLLTTYNRALSLSTNPHIRSASERMMTLGALLADERDNDKFKSLVTTHVNQIMADLSTHAAEIVPAIMTQVISACNDTTRSQFSEGARLAVETFELVDATGDQTMPQAPSMKKRKADDNPPALIPITGHVPPPPAVSTAPPVPVDHVTVNPKINVPVSAPMNTEPVIDVASHPPADPNPFRNEPTGGNPPAEAAKTRRAAKITTEKPKPAEKPKR